jgi:uncharacterized membrane protein
MRRFPIALYVFSTIAALAYVLATTPRLPAIVATHFGGEGVANGWMTRDGYRAFILLFVAVVPAVVVLAIGLLPRALPNFTNIPRRDYWLAPERRQTTFDYLLAQAGWFGCLIVWFIAGIHYLLLRANATSPAHLPAVPFVVLLAAFLVGLLAWVAVMHWRFRAAT